MKYTKIKKISQVESEPVYHLKVKKNHNFFANNLCVHNCDYTGEIMVILINHGSKPFEIQHGDRIAQLVISNVMSKDTISFKNVDSFSENTERGSGGFGSTGVK